MKKNCRKYNRGSNKIRLLNIVFADKKDGGFISLRIRTILFILLNLIACHTCSKFNRGKNK